MSHFLYFMGGMFCVFVIETAAQSSLQNCQPNARAIHFLSQNLSEAALTETIQLLKAGTWSPNDLEQLRTQIDTCNHHLVPVLQNYWKEKNNTHRQRDEFRKIENWQSELQAKKQRRLQIEQGIQSKIAEQVQAGMFVVLFTQLSTADHPQMLQEYSLRALHNEAVEDLNGTAIRRITELENLNGINDVIRATRNGIATQQGRPLHFNISDNRKYSIYAAVIAVKAMSPAEVGNKLQANQQPIVRRDSLVINLILQQNNFEDILLNAGVTADDVAAVRENFLKWKVTVQSADEKATSEKARIRRDGQTELAEIDQEIHFIEQKISRESSKITQTCRQLGIRNDPTNPAGCVKLVLQHFENKIKQIDEAIRFEREKEYFFESTIRCDAGNAAQLAAACTRLLETFEHRTTRSVIDEVIELKNGMSQSDQSYYEEKKDRKTHEIWVFVVKNQHFWQAGVCATLRFVPDVQPESPPDVRPTIAKEVLPVPIFLKINTTMYSGINPLDRLCKLMIYLNFDGKDHVIELTETHQKQATITLQVPQAGRYHFQVRAEGEKCLSLPLNPLDWNKKNTHNAPAKLFLDFGKIEVDEQHREFNLTFDDKNRISLR